MWLWNESIDVLRESMLAYAQICNGNLGYGILVVTFLARLALLPLGLRLARMAQAHQRAMQGIQPELDALRRKYLSDPRRLAEETRRVMAREGISPISAGGCIGALIQIPVFVALYGAVRQVASIGGRFLWVRDISKPDVIIGALATLFTLAATASGSTGPAPNRMVVLLMSAVLTAVALSKMAAGVGLYWGLSSLIGAAQGLVVQRRHRRIAA
jgi:YidC/Oxa1 family membrane protein insertase